MGTLAIKLPIFKAGKVCGDTGYITFQEYDKEETKQVGASHGNTGKDMFDENKLIYSSIKTVACKAQPAIIWTGFCKGFSYILICVLGYCGIGISRCPGIEHSSRRENCLPDQV